MGRYKDNFTAAGYCYLESVARMTVQWVAVILLSFYREGSAENIELITAWINEHLLDSGPFLHSWPLSKGIVSKGIGNVIILLFLSMNRKPFAAFSLLDLSIWFIMLIYFHQTPCVEKVYRYWCLTLLKFVDWVWFIVMPLRFGFWIKCSKKCLIFFFFFNSARLDNLLTARCHIKTVNYFEGFWSQIVKDLLFFLLSTNKTVGGL